jgi:hypothetical protein
MKNIPHSRQRRSGELGRKASRNNAITDGMMQTIMIIKRRLGFLSMRNPRAAKWNEFGYNQSAISKLTNEQNKSECIPRNRSFEKCVEGGEAKGLMN